MKKIMKSATAVALSAAMLASTAVCVSAEETKDVSITVFHYMTQTSKQAGLDAVEAAFAEAHPEYNITWDNVFYNQEQIISHSFRQHLQAEISLRS